MVAFARRSPRARLYSLVPRSSQCPSTRTSMFSCDFNQAALASSIFASVGRMSYLSKSKKTSFKSAMAVKSRGTGRAPPLGLTVGVAVAGVLVLGCMGVAPELAGALGLAGDPVAPAAPVGAGADAAIVAGRFAQPTMTTTSPRSATHPPHRPPGNHKPPCPIWHEW